MNYDALIVIDMQTALVERHPYNEIQVLDNIKRLCEACRQNQVPVIYICHDGGAGDELERGSDGWQIYKTISPADGDTIIHKEFNSAFRRTSLHQHLKSIGAKYLVMCGMQTEFCFDVSCKVAYELEYQVTVPKSATTTFDSEFATGEALSRYFEEKIWDHRYADVVPVEEIVKKLAAKG